MTKEDYQNQKCTQNMDAYVDRVIGAGKNGEVFVLKSQETGKRIKKAFAVTINGDMFYNLSAISGNLAKKDRLNIGNNQNTYLRALSRGTYDYMEYDNRDPSGPGAGLGTGGIGLGMSFNLGGSSIRGLIYDNEQGEFNVFMNCKDLNAFLDERHPELSDECKKKKIKIGDVRQVMKQLNGTQVANAVPIEEGAEKEIILYPHRSMTREECIIYADGSDFEFDGYDVLELTIPCAETAQFCVNDQQLCLDISCDDETKYYIVSFEKETKKYIIEPSNPDDFKYYSALMERRRNNRR